MFFYSHAICTQLEIYILNVLCKLGEGILTFSYCDD